MRKSTVFTVSALAFMLSLLLGSSFALASCPSVAGTYNLSQNFQGHALYLYQSDTTIWGWLVDDTYTATSISGSITCPDLFFGSAPTIQFTRFGSGFTQNFTGTMYVFCKFGDCSLGASAKLLHGTFTHNSTGIYGWYAAR